MKDLVTPVAVDEIRNVVRKCLENAALINYTKVNEMARNDGQTLTHSLTLCADNLHRPTKRHSDRRPVSSGRVGRCELTIIHVYMQLSAANLLVGSGKN